ncbi:MAG: sensor histidine kinase, partial [Candidatus Heimdallarchaeaceae archaeon]
YQSLYEDMNVFAKDLVTVTSLLRHDLLNDLVVIQSGIDLYQETGKKDYLERVINRTNTVAERLDSLKSESMLLESLAIQPIELDFVSNITDSFANTEIVSLPQDVKVNANRLLYPVIFNVIQNAFQHAGKDVTVKIDTVQENSNILMKIKDDGKGISEEEKKLIFQQGYRGTDKGVSGMGLYLVKMVLESYGGSISVSDNDPKGSIFTIKLTVAKS